MKIVVFGAGGQLGQCLADSLSEHPDIKFQLLDRSRFDIASAESYEMLQKKDVNFLINCAAYTRVDLAETERDQAHRINVTGPKLLGKYASEHQIPILHISTDYVYGPGSEPLQEQDTIDPVNYYGQTKWEGEEALRQSGAHHIILRTAWLYSEYGHNFVKTMLTLAESRSVINVVSDQIGSPTYAGDLASAIVHVLKMTENQIDSFSGTFNFANKGAVSWFQFAREILKEKEVEVLPIPTSSYPTPARRPTYSVLDSGLFERTFQWEIPHWKESLARCIVRLDPI